MILYFEHYANSQNVLNILFLMIKIKFVDYIFLSYNTSIDSFSTKVILVFLVGLLAFFCSLKSNKILV